MDSANMSIATGYTTSCCTEILWVKQGMKILKVYIYIQHCLNLTVKSHLKTLFLAGFYICSA